MKTIPILILLFITQHVFSQKVMPPRDETSSDPTLTSFVSDLKKAIAEKNEQWIYAHLDESVISTYGDEATIEVFKTYWAPETDSTAFWPYLERVVELGGVFLHDPNDETGRYQFVFPYAYDIEMEFEDDYFMYGVITGKNVNLRSAPNTKASVVRQLNYDVIFYIYDEEDQQQEVSLTSWGEPEWYHITTTDKKYDGWVNWKYVHSPYGARLFLFKDKSGKWKISSFVVGD